LRAGAGARIISLSGTLGPGFSTGCVKELLKRSKLIWVIREGIGCGSSQNQQSQNSARNHFESSSMEEMDE